MAVVADIGADRSGVGASSTGGSGSAAAGGASAPSGGVGGANLYGWAEDGRLPTREEVRNIPTATLVNLVSRLQVSRHIHHVVHGGRESQSKVDSGIGGR